MPDLSPTRRDLRITLAITTGLRTTDDITEAIQDALDRIGMDEHRCDMRGEDVWLPAGGEHA